MTTTYHTAIATGESNAPSTINTRLSALDSAIAARANEINAINVAGASSVYAQINNASGEGDTSWVIDNVSGTFLAGATVVYTVSGVVYSSVVAANTSTTPLTVTASPAVTIPDNTVISMVPPGIAGKVTDNVRNVKDPVFGAKGDGNTETSAITSALPTGGNASVVFPPGTYQIDSGLTIDQDGTALQGVGVVTIRRSQTTDAGANYVMLTIDGAENVVIDSITFSQHEYELPGGDAASDARTGIRITGCNNVVIRNCSFLKTGAYAIEVYNSTNVRIEGCYIARDAAQTAGTRGSYGVGIVRSSDVTVTGCKFLNVSCGVCGIVRFPSDGTYFDDMRGIVIANNEMDTISEHGIYINYAMDVTVIGNSLRNIDRDGIKVRAAECAITGNSIHSYSNGIGITDYSRNVTATGNSIRLEYNASRSNSTMLGVYTDFQGLDGVIASASRPAWIDSNSRCQNFAICANNIIYDGTLDVESTFGMRMIGDGTYATAETMAAQRLTIIGNTISNFMTGIHTAWCEEFYIIGNVLVGQDTSSAPTAANQGHGIHIDRRTPHLQIESNLIREFWNAINFGTSASSTADIVIRNNHITENNNYAIYFNITTGSSALTIEKNRYEGNTTGVYGYASGTIVHFYGTTPKGADATGTNVFGTAAGALGANTGFLKLYDAEGNTVYVPYWESTS